MYIWTNGAEASLFKALIVEEFIFLSFSTVLIILSFFAFSY